MAIGPISPIHPKPLYVSQPFALTPDERQRLSEAIDAINQVAQFGDQNELRMLVDENTRRPLIQIVNRDTHEVVRQIPPRYVLRMAAELMRMERVDMLSLSHSPPKRTT